MDVRRRTGEPGDDEGLNHDGGSSYTNHYLQICTMPSHKGRKGNQVDKSAHQLGASVNESGSVSERSAK